MMQRLERNKALVLEAMTELFQRRDPLAVERYYAPDYIQHNPDIPQGREALAKLVAKLPSAVSYEPGLVIAEGDFVAIHGRIRGWAPKPQIVVDIFRIDGGLFAEHWGVLQDEIPASASESGVAMFSPDEGTPPEADGPIDYDRLMQANLTAVFGERDRDRQLVAIRTLYAEDAVLSEPHATATGTAAIAAAVTALLDSLPPEFVFTADGPAVGHSGRAASDGAPVPPPAPPR